MLEGRSGLSNHLEAHRAFKEASGARRAPGLDGCLRLAAGSRTEDARVTRRVEILGINCEN